MKNKDQQKASRSKWSEARETYEIEKSKERVRKCRLRQKTNQQSESLSPVMPPSTTPFRSKQSLAKAMKKASTALPKSPRKKVAVVKTLSDAFVPLPRVQGNETGPAETDRLVQNFYESHSFTTITRKKRLYNNKERWTEDQAAEDNSVVNSDGNVSKVQTRIPRCENW